MAAKEFKTSRQQINILRSRGLVINKRGQGSKVIKILEKENYYSVVNGYKKPFIISTCPETYITGCSFEELYSLFVFDRNVRLIYLKYILKIEHYIKTVLAHEFSRIYGNNSYLNPANFDSTPCKLPQISKLINKINTETNNRIGKSAEITHYQNTYGFIPLWVLTNILTIGEISHFYECLKPSDMNSVARHFTLNQYDLALYLKNLTLARNLCAHDERFYDYRFNSALPVSRISNFSIFGIPSNSSGFFLYGTKDAFSIAVIFTQFLSKRDIKEFVSSIDKEFNKLSRELHIISVNDIKRIMGFASNWKKLSQL